MSSKEIAIFLFGTITGVILVIVGMICLMIMLEVAARRRSRRILEQIRKDED